MILNSTHCHKVYMQAASSNQPSPSQQQQVPQEAVNPRKSSVFIATLWAGLKGLGMLVLMLWWRWGRLATPKGRDQRHAPPAVPRPRVELHADARYNPGRCNSICRRHERTACLQKGCT